MEENTTPEPHKRSKSQKYKNFLAATPFLIVLTVIGVAVASFVGGMDYQKGHPAATTASSAASSGNTQFQNQSGGGFGGGGGGRFASNRVIGPVTAVSTSSITVQNRRSGSDVTLAITSSTQINDNGQSASASDIQVGDTVFVTEDSSNTSEATSILVNPSFGGGQSQNQSDSNAVTN